MDMDDPDGHGGSTAEAAAAAAAAMVVASPDKMQGYLRKVVPVLLMEDGEEGEEALERALEDKNGADALRKFLGEPQVRALLVSRSVESKDDDDDGDDGDGDDHRRSQGHRGRPGHPQQQQQHPRNQKGAQSGHQSQGSSQQASYYYTLSTDVHYAGSKMSGLVVVKKGPVVEAEKPLAAQIRLMTLSEGSPYETLHDYIASAVAPYFKSYVRESGKADREGDKMASSMEKKMTELEMGLLHLQQNIDIPEISLAVHPAVAEVIKTAEANNVKPQVADFGDKVEDSTFLNALQNQVSKWIREIQKVTKLDRDPSSGTALQEISFWLNLERALLRIQEKRESSEVSLTLEVLKHGKRFHATVSFDTDTGLKQAIATVNDYNPLMKDFPINDLLSATELDRVRVSVQAIFGHLRKIRNTKYPIPRALRLVEAISRDLVNQLMKILGTRRLMYIPFEDFEKVMMSCFEVFLTWDDEYERLQGLMRDLAKKKREDNLKMVWRVNFSHKRLQGRMEQMRRFRRQHEQLRTVIVRVLRPSWLHTRMAKGAGDSSAGTGRAGDVSKGASEDGVVGGHGTNKPEVLALEAADADAISEVNLAYENVKEVDGLDITKEGSEAWEGAMKRYDERIDRVETRITARLRDQLGTAKNANEMFRIFSRFNALFVRPHIRGAIREYQTQLIQRVKDDIEALHEKFKIQYPQSKAYRMSGVRDIPPVAGSIIWAKQIDRQLSAYMRRVEDVLGRGWENHIEGQKLKEDGDSFRVKLNTQEIFDDWARKVQQRNLGVSGRIFAVDNVRSRGGAGAGGGGGGNVAVVSVSANLSGGGGSGNNLLKLKVNFLPEIIQLSKEVRNLKNLGFRVPLAIVNKAHQANQLYPFAISLIESVRTYERSLEKMERRPNIVLLVAGLRKEVQNMIAEGIGLVWESYKLDPYVQRLAELVVHFQEKVDDLLVVEEEIDVDVRSLETCAYSANTFKDILYKIQKAVDDLSLHQYSNLHAWVGKLDEAVEVKLSIRLQAGVEAWTRALLGRKDDEDEEDDYDHMDTDNHGRGRGGHQAAHKLGGDPQIRKMMHDLRITNQIMYLFPSIEDCRYTILQQLFAWQAVVTSQERIQSTRYQVGLDRPATQSYKDLLTKLPSGQTAIEQAYEAVENTIDSVTRYVDEWLRYQALWDLQPDSLSNKFGEDIGKWMKLLTDIKKSRATFDTSETKKEFGPVVIDYGKVQSKVSLKYDSWHKDALGKFGNMLGSEMSDFHVQISKSRGELEQQSVEAASTSEAVNFITYVQGLKRKMKGWESQVNVYREGQRILERQRFQFPSQWLHVDNIEGEWSAFNEIIRRKDSSIQTQVSSLQMKIIAEDKTVEGKTNDYLGEWEKAKPVEGHIKPDDALQKLAIFESKYVRLKDERDNLAKAKDALELQEAPGNMITDEKMLVSWEELQDLKGVWSELAKIWEQIDTMKDLPWLSVQPRKLRQQIDSLLAQLKELPARLRQYASYEYVRKTMQNYAKANLLVVELKSDALKERHWKTLCRQLRVNWVLSDLSLGQVWDIDLLKNEAIIREVMLVAQGEMALEEFLKQVKETWLGYGLDMINYQNKCKLIRGWDDLFNKVKENINQLAAMKLSPYFKVFEEEALTWEDKLNRISALFDIWIDVQRRWVYLEGIFTDSADIKVLLPVETSRFNSISSEFLTLMKKVSKSPMVMDVLNIQGIQRSLERLADLLAKIQKALGEYLERERSSFPRFYFVGDEDLLEIIGNSKNIGRLQKHFKKMFAGVASVILDEQVGQDGSKGTLIRGLASREAEEVVFDKPVSTAEHPRINEWLTEVEKQMRLTLAKNLAKAVADAKVFKVGEGPPAVDKFLEWCDSYQAQVVVLAASISWTDEVETALQANSAEALKKVLQGVEEMLKLLADLVLQEQPPLRRKKLEHLIYEYVHRRTVTRNLVEIVTSTSSGSAGGPLSNRSFEWLSQMRFYFDPKQADVLQQLTINVANAQFFYGFEYLGVQERLVTTPLTDRCYLTMTQALAASLGGSPFGPAGTGKTETVKALGNQLGRFVLVFNCDETFDFQAMGRIFVGLCQVGAWGCFDEFNRLEERMLSAVSQQIQTIQECLKAKALSTDSKQQDLTVDIIGKQVAVNPDMAIFITMNPDYAGRSNLPDNLKKLFRSLAMTRPDETLIAEVMLFSQGFRSAERLSKKIVPLFKLCQEQLSAQSHYDFGLRALKSVLVSAGNVKRERIQKIRKIQGGDSDDQSYDGDAVESSAETSLAAEQLPEQEILVQSVCETMVPKLVAEDIPLLFSLLSDVFPGIAYSRASMEGLKKHIRNVCQDSHLVCGIEEGEVGHGWTDKILQLYQISQINHGLMMVGPSGSGKSSAWRVLLRALELHEGVEGVAHVIDPKAITKDALYGVMDPNTREWRDGLFTHILRRIIDNVRGEINKRQWIVFDGDVDPEWVENLNSVLDNNKLLTLPNGERLALPPNVRVMFEVHDLKYATLATVSRCGMVWFSQDVLTMDMVFSNFLSRLQNVALEDGDDDLGRIAVAGQSQQQQQGQLTGNGAAAAVAGEAQQDVPMSLKTQRDIASVLAQFFTSDGLVQKCLDYAETMDHVMDFTRLRALGSLFSLLNQVARDVLQYNQAHSDFPLQIERVEKFVSKSLISAIIWSFTGDGKMKVRDDMSDFIRSATTVPLPPNPSLPIIDYEVSIQGEWVPWANKVPQMEVETHKVASPDIVVPTLDTVRHEALLYTWLADHKPMLLCGPPGSGKTMTLFSALRALPDMEVVGLNFSSATTPELLMKTLDHYCVYNKTPNGIVLAPNQLGKWLIMFCDEINLPDMDKYGTQRVISFLRQLVEHNGFYRQGDQAWVTLERIQFVGACNPPTDPGRKPLAHRFLRHVPIVYVDYPGETSLKQIYGTFCRAMLRLVPAMRSYAEPLTNAMVEFFLRSQERFTQDMQPHYVYSPREMTRWVRGICEAIRPLETLSVEGLVRLYAHEGLRLFQDRLVYEDERAWTNENVDEIAAKHFPNVDRKAALGRPILFSNWMDKNYVPVDREELRHYVKARLKVFYEEELDVPLVLFNEVLEHVLRIDRIFRQPQGHLLLIGTSGSGKTTLSRFVAWMNGLSVFQIKIHNKYSMEDFDEDLRQVLRRSGCKDEKICFVLDESNVMDSSFLERMNTLLANGEVPGLFEGDDFTTLMTQCKEGAQREGLMLDSPDELYKWFTGQVMKNLHVVFTMNPSEDGLKDRASTSPALFNRCVVNWFGDWSDEALFQVGREFTVKVDLERADWERPDFFPEAVANVGAAECHRSAVVNAMVFVHQTLHQTNRRTLKRGGRVMAITPRHFLDFINHFVKLYGDKRSGLEEEQLHLNVGLNKIAETVGQVEEMQRSLAVKSKELQTKNDAANAKLKQMVKDQQEAEKQRTQSQELSKILERQKVEIAAKKKEVMADLEQVEPAVIDAQQAVKSIRKQHLVEVRSMANPPPIVKLALESICLLLGENSPDWKAIRSVLMKENFISTIVNFNTDDITDDVREKMKTRFLSNPDYNFEKVNRASLACGPMVKWAIAQLNFADMLKRVEPLRNELRSLEEAAEQKQQEADEMTELILGLERSINSYKEEYAQLISQAEAIKNDLKQVQDKVDRSMSLLKSLGMEKGRWQETSDNFRSQMSTLVGDVLLSSAFLAYAGYFDQQSRGALFGTWKHHLDLAGVRYRADLARTEFLSDPDQRLSWQAHRLPADDLCTENAIMLSRFNRYPLIIDPSGQATDFILEEYKGRKIAKTSFLDDSFRKNLESALRFGNPLLVQDVENYDPILNPVLNRELKRTGGRVLITLGDQDIDLSPSFTIFLSTRDPTVEFAPDICSRVTMVNFTVTRSSLQMQCLNQVLKAERPDIDQKRSDLLKLQGEFQLRLRHLEKDLLQCLNEVKGRILDDDTVITTLETLKGEAAEVSREASATEEVMREIETTSQQYMPLAASCSSIYFTMDNLHQVHFLYQYSLQFFLDIFHSLLVDGNGGAGSSGVSDPIKRLALITSHLFDTCYNRVSRGMLNDDRVVFALLLSKIQLRGRLAAKARSTSESATADLENGFHHLLRGEDEALVAEKNWRAVAAALKDKFPTVFPAMADLVGTPTFNEWMDHPNAEDEVPQVFVARPVLSDSSNQEDKPAEQQPECSAEIRALYNLLAVKAFRPDRFVAGAQKFILTVFGGGENFRAGERPLDLATVVEREVKPNSPVLMCSVPGYDASGRVDDLAVELTRGIASVAIGSEEGFAQADKAINTAAKSGRWVMLKNVHLAPSWLVTLEKKLHSLQAHPNFRLFLTCEINPKIPVNLLRAGRILTFEPPPGIKANLLRTFATIPPARMMKAPNERARLYFVLSWFHAVIQERLRYAPLGWSKKYEFSESDLRVACDMLDQWVDSTSMGRTNLPPQKVPWKAMRTLLSQCIYGGKIDNEFDQRLLQSFLDSLFSEKCFESDYKLAGQIAMPDCVRRDQFLAWVEQLADKLLPEVLGLPNNAETVLLTNLGRQTVMKLLKMQQLDDEDELAYSASGDDQNQDKQQQQQKPHHPQAGLGKDSRPAWMRTLHDSAKGWTKCLPDTLVPLKRTADNIKDPLYRFYEREVNLGCTILNRVRSDLRDLLLICQGEKKQTNDHRLIIANLTRGVIPKTWALYKIPFTTTVIQWINDFVLRIKQLREVSSIVSGGGFLALRAHTVWLGGLFNPEAFITATRQCVAQANSWSLEELHLDVFVGDEESGPMSMDDCSFGIEKLKLQGAVCKNNQLSASASIITDLHTARLRWMLKSTKDDMKRDKVVITLPVYLNATRSDILFRADFTLADRQDKFKFYERGVALIASMALN